MRAFLPARLLPILALFATQVCVAATFTVTNTNDDGPGSLRRMVADAQAGAGDNTIVFDLPEAQPVIKLTSLSLPVRRNVTILNDRPGDKPVTIQVACPDLLAYSGFEVLKPARLVLAGLTITGPDEGHHQESAIRNSSSLFVRNCTFSGNNANLGGAINNEGEATISDCRITGNFAHSQGGGIYNNGGKLSLNKCIISDNTADAGGGIMNQTRDSGFVTMVDCVVSGNRSTSPFGDSPGGAGLENWGIVGMSNCIFSDNRVVEWGGGAIYTRGGLTANNCTFVNNKGEHGGAIWDYGSRDPSFLNNCTFSANSAVSGGAAIYANHQYSTREHPKLRLSNCTFSQNFPTDGAAQMLANGTAIMSAGGSFSGGSPMTTVVVANSIFRKFGNVPSLAAINGGVIVSLGHNLSDDAADGDGGTGPGALLNGPGDRRNTDPLLGDLADNGGPTPTHALLAGSPAINAGDNTTAPPRDQRGYAREGVYDIGAFEFNSAPPQTHLANISTRAYCLSKDNVLIAGFIITGQDAKKLIVRAIGPSLAAVTRLRDPTLELFNALGQRIAFNNNWGDAPNHQEIVDTTLAPKNNLESAILLTLPPGAYTAVLRGVNDSNGLAVAEVYDLDPGANSRLANISTRSYVQGGENVMIGGFILHGPESETVVIRAIGPSLSLAKPLPDPEVTLKDANGTVLATSYDWRFDRTDDSGVGKVLATGLSPRNDFEGALVTTLPPGQYTAIVHDTEDAVGVGLVEVYALD